MAGVAREQRFIGRYRNPWQPAPVVHVLAGLYAIRTHAIGTFLADFAHYEHLPNVGSTAEMVRDVR